MFWEYKLLLTTNFVVVLMIDFLKLLHLLKLMQ